MPLAHARIVIGDWKREYNHHRRQSALGYQPPACYAASCRTLPFHTLASWLALPCLATTVVNLSLANCRASGGRSCRLRWAPGAMACIW
jgi:hypothetical protein